MAQENANILHAAIHVAADGSVLAATGVEVDSLQVVGSPGPVAGTVLALRLVTPIDDSELIVSAAWGVWGIGDGVIAPINIGRDPADAERRTFYIYVAFAGVITSPAGAPFCVSWWRIPGLGK